MFEEKSNQLDRLMTLLDSAVTIIFFIVAFYGSRGFLSEVVDYETIDFFSHMSVLPLFLALVLYFLSYFGAYRQPRGASLLFYIIAIVNSMITALALILLMVFIFDITYVNRFIVIVFGVCNTLGLILIRIAILQYFRFSLKKGKNFIQLLIVGTGPRAQMISKKLKAEAEWGIRIVGHVDPDASMTGQIVDGAPVLGSVMDIHKILKNNVVDEVVIATPRSMLESVGYVFFACEEEGVRVRFMADFFDFRVVRVRIVEFAEIPLMTLEPVVQDEVKLLIKRGFDLFLTLLFLPIIGLLMAIIALAIKLDSPGPVFFVQDRIGWKKRPFKMFKFRSMVPNAEELMAELEEQNEAEGPIFKMANDPRVTRVGRFLRRTSLDELPQLINVLKGEMSLVGPRPMSVRDVDLFDKGIQRKRFSVKPGLTCFWQISGRSNLPFSEWLELDLKYINNWSLMLDFIILFKTIPAVLLKKGAV